MYSECQNCSSVWSPGSEEWEIQQCSSCGWRPGMPVDDDDDDYDPYNEDVYDDDPVMGTPADIDNDLTEELGDLPFLDSGPDT